MPRADLELAVNDIFREVVAAPAPAKLVYVSALFGLGLVLGVGRFGPPALALFGLAYFFVLGWAYGGDALR